MSNVKDMLKATKLPEKELDNVNGGMELRQQLQSDLVDRGLGKKLTPKTALFDKAGSKGMNPQYLDNKKTGIGSKINRSLGADSDPNFC